MDAAAGNDAVYKQAYAHLGPDIFFMHVYFWVDGMQGDVFSGDELSGDATLPLTPAAIERFDFRDVTACRNRRVMKIWVFSLLTESGDGFDEDY